MKVKDLRIREIFATNSLKTIELELETDKCLVRSSVPIGTSRGKHEVFYLPSDQIIRKFPLLKRYFRSQKLSDQEEVDATLKTVDKTSNFREIGGNLALAISSAFLKAFAAEENQEIFEYLSRKCTIPGPICNVVGGWRGQSDIQEFLLLPVHQKSFFNSIEKITAAYKEVGQRLKMFDPNFNFGKNIESAWLTSLNFEKVLNILTQVANEHLLKIGLDVAASQLWNGICYTYSNGEKLGITEQLSLMEELARKYPIIYIEDPFEEEDFVSFSTLTHRLQHKLVCGDDLYSTNLKRLQYGLTYKSTNSMIIKPSQIGTITDTIAVVKEAKKHDMITVMSHRSGETEDTLICHLAVGLNCNYIKLGISGERVIKINEMIRIEEKLRGH
jgi:enolase